MGSPYIQLYFGRPGAYRAEHEIAHPPSNCSTNIVGIVDENVLEYRTNSLNSSTEFSPGICLTTDLDTLLYHMNNARYLREIDFARVDFYERTHLYRTIVAHGGAVVQGASTIRYRRFIRPFRTYRIQSRIIYWDEQSIFMEHRFVSPRDGFVHCVALCRQRLIDCSAIDVMAELLQLRPQRAMPAAVALGGGEKSHSVAPAMTNGTTPTTIVVSTTAANAAADVSIAAATTSTISESCGKSLRPELPADVAKWIEYNELSSASLRQDC